MRPETKKDMARDVKRIRSTEVKSIKNGRNGGFVRLIWLLGALLLAISAGGLTGILASYYLNNSRYSVEVSALATYRPPQVTTIYADDGETVLAEFAIEKRIPIKEQDIPKNVEDALIAIEDISLLRSHRDRSLSNRRRRLQELYDRQDGRRIDHHAAARQEPFSL